MVTYEIYWDDLTVEARERLKGIYHDNLNIEPIAIIEVEAENEEKDNPDCNR